MHLYLVRHAESANNQLYATTGSSVGRHPDPPLTERGHQQAQVVARYLAARPDNAPLNPYARRHNRGGFDLTHLYCSLMVRAVATAGYIAEATGLSLHAWPEIHERGGLHDVDDTGQDIGVAGPGRAFFVAEYPTLVLPDTLGDTGWWSRPREAPEEYLPRARAVLEGLLARHGETEHRVALVTHGGFFHSFMQALLERSRYALPPAGDYSLWFSVDNTAITYIELGPDRAAIRYLNRVDHLPDDLLSS